MLLLGAVADSILMCLRSNQTLKSQVKRALKKLLGIKRLPTGFVLTHQSRSTYLKFKENAKKHTVSFAAHINHRLISK